MTSPCSSTVRRHNLIGPLAHPPERTYPCCIPALGEFSTVTPYEGSGAIIVTATDRVHLLGRIRIAAECARLESVYRATYRGFKSLILRQLEHPIGSKDAVVGNSGVEPFGYKIRIILKFSNHFFCASNKSDVIINFIRNEP